MAAADVTSTRWHPLPLYKVLYEQLFQASGPVQREVWVRAQSPEHAAWKAANLVDGWELIEVIRVR